MHSSYQLGETHHADMSLSVHDRINDLNRRAERLAPAVAESAMDSGCTDRTSVTYRELGPRQRKAWDLIAEAYGWNAISDSPELLAEAERYERAGVSYKIDYVGGMDPQASPFVIVVETGAPVIDADFDSDRDGSWTPDGQRLSEHDAAERLQQADDDLHRALHSFGPDSEITRRARAAQQASRETIGQTEDPDACPVHGWRGCLCSGAPDYRVAPTLVSTEPLDRIAAEDSAPEPFTINGAPACGAPVDGGRCGRHPHHGGHPHIKEPGTKRPRTDQAEWLAGEYAKASAENLAANRAAERLRGLDQAQHDVNRLYLQGEMTQPEWLAAGAAIDAEREPKAAAVITITSQGHNLWAVTRDGTFVAALRWSGEHMRLVDPEGEHLGDLFRSDGKRVGGEVTYTWRAYRPGPGGAEVARRASQEDAVSALLSR